jgi:NAD(P)H-dependent FMN reductase
MAKLFIPVILGTVREDRQSERAARLVYEVGQGIEEIEVQFVDPRDYQFAGDGNDPEGKDARYTEITERADGFFIVTPEYNHSFPSTIKRMLDSELKNYIHKPVAFGGVSDGPWGGVRAIEALVTTVREMGMVATFTDVNFPMILEFFDDQGKPKEPKTYDRIQRAYTELIWMAKVLKYGREQLPTT